MPADSKPSYYKVHRDLWRSIDDLPFPQNAKLLYALIRLFFENVEPSAKELPREARRIYLAKRQDVLSYRRNVLNGKKSHGGRRMKAPTKTTPETDAENPTENTQDIFAPTVDLPAITSEVGTHPDHDPSPNPSPNPSLNPA